MYKNNYYILFLILILSVSFCSQSPVEDNLSAAIESFKKDKDLKNAGISFLAVDTKTGETIGEINQELALAPASTMKLITTATGLEILGSNYKFKTELQYTGEINNETKTLTGNIIIRGGGDPTLNSKFFNQEDIFLRWVTEIEKLGINKIDGYILADESIYSTDIVPSTWSWEDMGNYFGAGACGLSINDNLYEIEFKTGPIGSKAEILKIEPFIKELTFDNQVLSANVDSDMSYIFGGPYEYHRYIRGELPANKEKYIVKGSMPDPAFFTANMLFEKLSEKGISVTKSATTYRKNKELIEKDSSILTLIYSNSSPSLEEIIYQTNHRSINLFAEHILNQIGTKTLEKGETKSATNYIQTFWGRKGMDNKSFSMNDGCGLSRYNTITAKQMVFMLQYMKTKSKYFDSFYKSLPIAGKTGTVRSLCKNSNAENNLRAKSGTIRDVRAYSGYVTTLSGREIAFSICINNYNCSPGEAKNKIEKVLIALADYNL